MSKGALKPTGALVLVTFLALVLGFSLTALGLRAGATEVSANLIPNVFSAEDHTLGDLQVKLTPFSAVNRVGTPHTLTATVSTTGNRPVADKEVFFEVLAGPTEGVTGSGVTDANGRASFTYTGNRPGIDTISACIDNNGSDEVACSLAIKRWIQPVADFKIVLEPARDSNPVGTDHILTATVTRGSEPVTGARVAFRVTDGPQEGKGGNADTDAAGHAGFTYTGDRAGVDTIQACVRDPNLERVCATARKAWTQPVADLAIALEPARDSNLVGTDHTLTATVTRGTEPVTGVTVAFRVTDGPHQQRVTGSGTTDRRGQASFTYTGARAGTDTIMACVLDPDQGRVCARASKTWTRPVADFKIILEPARDSNPVGTGHTVTATVTGPDRPSVSGLTVHFRVTGGPHQGTGASRNTDRRGEAGFTYTGVSTGTDTIQACVEGPNVGRVCARASKTWTEAEAPPVSRDSCRGENSCRGRNISVGQNSCNAEDACNGNNLTIGDNSCNEEHACRGNGSTIGDRSCNEEDACRGNQQRIGNNSCNEEEACRGNNIRVGNRSCNGEEACNGNNTSIGNGSCNAEEACRGHNGSVGNDTCNREDACPARGNQGRGQGQGQDLAEDKGKGKGKDQGGDKGKGKGNSGDSSSQGKGNSGGGGRP